MKEPSLHYFSLREDKLVWIEDYTETMDNESLWTAIKRAIEVSNRNQVYPFIVREYAELKPGTVYSLLCSVEKKSEWLHGGGNKFVALVTFPESGEKIKLFPCGENACALSSSVGGKITACKDKCQLDSGEKQSQEETQEELLSDILSQFKDNEYDKKFSPEVALSDQTFIVHILEHFTITRK
jgi:hypothetical protein